MRLLVASAYTAASWAALKAGGAKSSAHEIFPAVLRACDRSVDITALDIADGEELGHNRALGDFDGILITGSPLGVYEDRHEVARMINFARTAFESRVPVWGSCFGLQVMSKALGGEVHLNPKGTEVGIARRITPTAIGEGHPLFAGKPRTFDAVASHQDEVSRLPEGARLLAGNAMSEVQAVEIERNGSHFWGVQYHPEYDLEQLGILIRVRAERLTKLGLAHSVEAMHAYAEDLIALGRDPARRDIAWHRGVPDEVRDQGRHQSELGNWLKCVVAPRLAQRDGAARVRMTA